jgi:hypothetical protein
MTPAELNAKVIDELGANERPGGCIKGSPRVTV